jgi:hypothetical protein
VSVRGFNERELTIRIKVNNLTAIIVRDVASINSAALVHARLVLRSVCRWCTNNHPGNKEERGEYEKNTTRDN